jgi:hypothetical protein
MEVRPLDRIDHVQQREVKPSSRGLTKGTVRPSLVGPSLQPPKMARDYECQQASVSPNVAMYLTSAERYLDKFTMTEAKKPATSKTVGMLRKDRPRKAKKHAQQLPS